MELVTQRQILPALTILSWLIVMAFSFWWFEYRHWQSFTNASVTFDGEDLGALFDRVSKQAGESKSIKVMHFTDEECACSSYSRGHIKNLQSVLIKSDQFIMTTSDTQMIGIHIPATPSVAVWDEAGELAYFGPYSAGAICGTGVDFVTRVMIELEQKKNPKWINMMGVGCYCPWPQKEKYNA